MNALSHKTVRAILRDKQHLPYEIRANLDRHLEDCQQCREYATSLDLFSKHLKPYWEDPVLTQNKKDSVITRITEKNLKKRISGSLLLSLQYLGYAVMIVVLLFAFSFTLSRLLPPSATPMSNYQAWHLTPNDPGLYVVLDQDMNCDDIQERLLVQKSTIPGLPDEYAQVTQIFLENTNGGSAQRIWELTARDLGALFFLTPQVIHYDECTYFISVSAKEKKYPNIDKLNLFWVNQEGVKRVLATTGWLKEYATENLTSLDGTCNVQLKTYRWENSGFNLIQNQTQTLPCNSENE